MESHDEQPPPLPHGTIRVYDENNQDAGMILHPHPTDSPDDPLNWPLARKYLSASIVLFITGFTGATSNNFGSAGTAFVDDYNISWGVQNTAAGVLFIGIGYGTLLLSASPWLYGRRISYLICLVWSIIGCVWFSKIKNDTDAILSQLFIGGSEAVAEATVQLSLFDIFFQHQRGMVMGLYVLAVSVGTFMGPLISGYIADSDLNWPWIGWFAAIISGVTIIVTYFGLEETGFERDIILTGASNSRPTSPERTTKSLEEKIPSEVEAEDNNTAVIHHHDADLVSREGRKTYWQRIALITPSSTLIGWGFKQYFARLVNNVKIMWFPAVIYAGLQWGFQDAWLTFYLTAEEDNYTSAPYNYGDAKDSVMNVPTLIGAIIGCFYGGYLSDLYVNRCARKNGGIYEAEDRLWLMIAPAILSPIGMIIFGIATNKVWPWPWAYCALGLIGFGWGCAGDLSLSYAMDVYPDMILEGMVGVAVINNTLACIFTFVCSIWMDENSVQEVFIAVGIISFLAMFPVTGIMIAYGKKMRTWTTPSYEKFLYGRG